MRKKYICDYVENELDLFRKECNFCDEEMEFFNLHAQKRATVKEMSNEMHISLNKYYRIKGNVEDKIECVEDIFISGKKYRK